MPRLTITDDKGRETVKVEIRNLDPTDSLMAILGALKPLPEVPDPGGRKPRKDKGKPRPRATPAGGTSTAADPTPE